jgi:hypothetical protein
MGSSDAERPQVEEEQLDRTGHVVEIDERPASRAGRCRIRAVKLNKPASISPLRPMFLATY